MNYYISRGGQQYGPYSLADVQKYIAQGSISPGDFARTETMSNWVPLSQLLAAAAAPSSPPTPPVQQPPAQPQWAGYQPQAQPQPQPQPQPQFQPQHQPQPQPAAYGQPAYPGAPTPGMQPPQGPQAGGLVPPSLHWALVLVLGWVTCGVFSLVWMFIQSSFIKKIRPASNVTMLYVVYIALIVVGEIVNVVAITQQAPAGTAIGGLLCLGAMVVVIIAIFKARSLLLEYYNTVEPINLRLSGVMTFFFNILYFQYHFTRIAEWKRTGMLSPQK